MTRSSVLPPVPPRQSSPGRPQGKFIQAQRLNRLKILLSKRPSGATLSEIADHLNISNRSARRYLKQLDGELKIEKVDGPGRAPLWRFRPQQRLRKVEFTRSQAYAMLAVRPMFSVLGGSALHEDIQVIYEKVLDIAKRPFRGALGDIPPAKLEERFLILPEAPVSYEEYVDEIDAFFWAIAELHPVRAVRTDISGHDETVVVHPYALVVFQDVIWVIGAIRSEDGVRVIPLQEFRYAEQMFGERFELPSDFNVLNYMDGGFGPTTASSKIRVIVDFDSLAAPQVRLRSVHPSQRLSALPQGGVRWTASVRDLGPVGRWVLGFGQHARVVEPEALRTQLVNELNAAIGRYRPTTT